MRSRKGFTLIELMVSMALTLFVMAILSQAFVIALETFGGLKGLGDMQANLRTAANLLRADLVQDHLEGKRRVSDPTLLSDRPREGFFAIRQGGPSVWEGNDSDGLPSYRAVNHVIHMAVKRKGNRRESFFTTQVNDANFFSVPTMYGMQPPTIDSTSDDATLSNSKSGVYGSQWAEVAYFLVQTGTMEEPSNPTGVGAPLYSLFRAQLVSPPDASNVNNKFANGGFSNFLGLSCLQSTVGPNIAFFSPNDLANPATRVYTTTNPFPRGATMALPNVLSFQVQAMRPTDTTFIDIGNFDTANAGFTLRAVQITLRVWDSGTKQARQMTVVQDL